MSDSAYSAGQAEASIDAGLVLRAVLKNLVRIAFVTALLCAAAYAVLLFVPKLYESRAELLIEPRSTAYTSAASNQNADTYYIDIATVSSAIELIKSRDTIRAAIAAMDLLNDPAFEGRTEASLVSEISDNLIVTQERSSRLIAVAYRDRDPEMAARIANGVAVAHIERRAGQQISDTVEATAWLQQEIDRLRADVSEAERAIADFRVQNDLFTGANNESLTNQQLSNFASQITAAAERRSAAQSRAQLIRALLESGQSVIGVSDVQASSVGQQLSQELGRLQGERAQRSATLLPNHPTIRSLDAQIAEIEGQITAEGRRIAAALEAQAQIEADLQQSLQAELDRLKVTAGSDTIEGVTLAELEREAAAQRDLLNAYLLRFTEATARSDVASALPDVRIVSEAAPSSSPATPKTMLILAAVGIASILLQVGGVIFSELLSGRALVERRAPDSAHSETEASEAHPPVLTNVTAIEAIHQAAGTARATPSLDVEIEAIAAAAIAGVDRILVIGSTQGGTQSLELAERLTAKLINEGQSVAEIDAASGSQGIELGLADLCAQEADFGEVVHRGMNERFAFVPWGQAGRLEHNVERARTLVEALSDIYEVVIIVTGEPGAESSLALFGGVGAKCLLLVAEDDAVRDEQVVVPGYDKVQTIPAAYKRSEVA